MNSKKNFNCNYMVIDSLIFTQCDNSYLRLCLVDFDVGVFYHAPHLIYRFWQNPPSQAESGRCHNYVKTNKTLSQTRKAAT